MPTEFADHQRKAMLRAIHEREGRWDKVAPDTEAARIGKNIGLSEDQSYELFGHLVDEGLLDPGRAYSSGGAMPGSISRIATRFEKLASSFLAMVKLSLMRRYSRMLERSSQTKPSLIQRIFEGDLGTLHDRTRRQAATGLARMADVFDLEQDWLPRVEREFHESLHHCFF